jgi:hypothetical protein
MIRHIHFNRWKPGTSPETIDKVFEMLADFPQRFPEIQSMGLHRDAKLGDVSPERRNYDFAIILDFVDVAAFRQYMAREEHHQVVATYIRPFQEAAARMQFEIPES